MNFCIINGHKVFPALGKSIKITKENPLIKDRDAQTMEIEFPLAIYSNRKFFGNLNRIDVAKHSIEYKDCILYARNVLIIKGKATVTTFTNQAVKLQIVSGVRLSGKEDYYSSIYIDEINAYQDVSLGNYGKDDKGVESVYALPPVYDETNGVVLNRKDFLRGKDGKYGEAALQNVAIQPYLTNVVRMVFQYLGYTLDKCFLDEKPWSDILIYNNRYAITLKGALPHWSVKTFLDEFKKLFNLGFVYDEDEKKVSLNRYFDTFEKVEYECLDEFSTDYDEEGLEYLGASNLAYNLSDAEDNKYADIDEDVLSKFNIKEYVSMSTAQKDLQNMTEAERMTTVFSFTNDPFGEKWGYCRKATDDEGNSTFTVTAFAWFMHVRREENSDNEVLLNMVPAAMHHVEFDIRIYDIVSFKPIDYSEKIAFSMPASTNDSEYEETETYSEYVSVQDYLENGNEPAEKEEAERMELYFLTGNEYAFEVPVIEKEVTFMTSSNDYVLGSFRFNGGMSQNYIGKFHDEKKWIENKEQLVIKFISDDVPDPKKIFVFRNKRFLCDKIEMEINDTGINKLMTGYFYEMLS